MLADQVYLFNHATKDFFLKEIPGGNLVIKAAFCHLVIPQRQAPIPFCSNAIIIRIGQAQANIGKDIAGLVHLVICPLIQRIGQLPVLFHIQAFGVHIAQLV